MKLFFLFGANVEQEEVDILSCWSEYDLDANYEGWVEEIEEKKKIEGYKHFGLVTAHIDETKILKHITAPLKSELIGMKFEELPDKEE
jgi:hypothetical protein